MTLLVGPSGCGKTTFLSVIAGILDCDGGEVIIFGQSLTAMSDRARTVFRTEHRIRHSAIQPPAGLDRGRECGDPADHWRLEPKAGNRAQGAVLATIGMAKRLESLPKQLSGGEQQRVAIARLGPRTASRRLRRADSALDRETGIAVMRLLHDAAVRPDRAVIIVTHDNRVFDFGDRTAEIDDGAIACIEDRRAAIEAKQTGAQAERSRPASDTVESCLGL